MWTNKEYQFFLPTKRLRKANQLSERELAHQSHISRVTLRQIDAQEVSVGIQSLIPVSQALGRKLAILGLPEEVSSESSTVAVSLKVIRDGFESWKIHFMELVDEFRRSLDPRLILLPPVPELDLKLKSLLASIVSELALEADMDIPDWAGKRYVLDKPWFVAEIESLKASALIESPPSFRKNNIFVLSNFLQRA